MQQAAMTKTVPIDTSPTIDEAESRREHRPFALWASILTGAVVVCGGLAEWAPPSSDPSQLAWLSTQTGMFP